ncbi:hypothetical protein EF902_44140, partial [Streptomyces sp. WAC05858]
MLALLRGPFFQGPFPADAPGPVPVPPLGLVFFGPVVGPFPGGVFVPPFAEVGLGLMEPVTVPRRFFQRSSIVSPTACQNVVRPEPGVPVSPEAFPAPAGPGPPGFQPPFDAPFTPPGAVPSLPAPGFVPPFGVLLTPPGGVPPPSFFGLFVLLRIGVDGWRRFHRSLSVLPTACGSVVRPLFEPPFDVPE